MNSNDSNSSQNPKNPAQNPEEKPNEPTPPKTHPISSPDEPTRAYPTDPSRTYSSDPSQYAYPPNPPSEESTSSKVYTTESLDTARIATEERRSIESQTQKDEDKNKDKEAFESTNRQTSKGSHIKGDFYNYMASNREQTITYILLVLGLILTLFANGLLGGLIIGMVAGYYFASEIIYYIRNLGQIVGGQDQLRYIVLAALALGLFIAAPGIFIGAVIVATFKQVMAGPQA